jgi:hypothetical protein
MRRTIRQHGGQVSDRRTFNGATYGRLNTIVPPPVLYSHHPCGEIAHAELHCSRCGKPMHASNIDILAGPGAAA